MPWETTPVSELRLALVHAVRSAGLPVAEAARRFGVSRKTAFKWLGRYDARPGTPLCDRSRRPRRPRRPRRTPDDLERLVLDARDRWGWGPRKLHALLRREGHAPPPVRTVAAILRRHGRTRSASAEPAPPPQRFERPAPTSSGSSTSKAPSRSPAGRSCPSRSSTTTAATSWPSAPAPT